MTFRNDCASLDLHRLSLRGKVKDYIFTFNEEQTDMGEVLHLTLGLFRQLIESYADQSLTARLVAKVRFIHMNNVTNEEEERYYHFSSYQSEKVVNVDEFFNRHMAKIVSRLDSFNVNGSNLLIKNIAHLHVLLTLNKQSFHAK